MFRMNFRKKHPDSLKGCSSMKVMKFQFLQMLFIFFLLAGTSCRPAGPKYKDEWSNPFPGIRYLYRQTERPQIRYHAVMVDLCSPGISIRATPPDKKGLTVSAFAESINASIAVNGDFYMEKFHPLGLAAGDGNPWPGTKDRLTHGLIGFGKARSWMPPHDTRITELPEDITEVVGGRPVLIREGKKLSTGGRLCDNRHPRTAVGISKDYRTLIIAVVDGRSSRSAGVTCSELSVFLGGLGAYNALNLDGGGSSLLWMKEKGIVNRPSDGIERPVANHLGIIIDPEEKLPSHCPEILSDEDSVADEPAPDEAMNADHDDL